MGINTVAVLFKTTKNLPIKLKEMHFHSIREVVPDAKLIIAEDEAELLPRAEEIDILLTWGMYKPVELLTKARNLKWIHTLSAGVEGIMSPEIIKSEVRISNTRGIHGFPMTDHVIAFIFSFLRKFPVLFQQQRRKEWLVQPAAEESFNKTVGIVGLGAIGSEIARKCNALGLRVIATKRTPVENEWIERLYPVEQLDDMLSESDFIVVIVPLTDETKGLIGASEIKAMKNSAYLINVARGPVVDEEALIEGLKNGEIAGAGLDVYQQEPLPADSPLWEMENVIISPRMSAVSPYYADRAVKLFCENAKLFIKEGGLKNEINKDQGY